MPNLPEKPYPWGVAATPPPERPRPAIAPVPQHGEQHTGLAPLDVVLPPMDECATLGLALLRKHAGGHLAVTLEVGSDPYTGNDDRMAWVTSPGLDEEDLPASVRLVLEALGWQARNGNAVPKAAWWDPTTYETHWVYLITP